MDKIQRLITPYNFNKLNSKINNWIVVHYVGAVSSAKNNALYFYNNDLRGTNKASSANYFVDEFEVWQSVEDYNGAWHIGAYKYYNGARNNNSIGIEMCCKKKNGNWYIEPETIKKTIQLVKSLMLKYNIPIERVVTHYQTTGKLCPEPFVRMPELWLDFKNKLEAELMADIPELSLNDKIKKIKEVMNIDDNTIQFNKYYKYGIEYLDKQYKVCVDAEKWRNLQKNEG